MNPYLRAAQAHAKLADEAAVKLAARLHDHADIELTEVQGICARNVDATFRPDDPATPDLDEAWT